MTVCITRVPMPCCWNSGVQLNVLEQYRVLDRRGLQPSGIVVGDCVIRTHRQSVDCRSISSTCNPHPSQTLLANALHGVMDDAPAEAKCGSRRVQTTGGATVDDNAPIGWDPLNY
jgi:hypothetical protein